MALVMPWAGSYTSLIMLPCICRGSLKECVIDRWPFTLGTTEGFSLTGALFAGKGSTSGQILGGAQILGSQQSLGTRPSAQAPVHGLDERTAAEQDLSLEASKEVRTPTAFVDAAEALQDFAYFLSHACAGGNCAWLSCRCHKHARLMHDPTVST